MSLVPLSFAQHAIARGIETWCCGEGICTSRTTLASFGTAVHPPSTVLLLRVGDSDICVGTDCVVVRMPHRTVSYDYDPVEPVARVVQAVTRVLETG